MWGLALQTREKSGQKSGKLQSTRKYGTCTRIRFNLDMLAKSYISGEIISAAL